MLKFALKYLSPFSHGAIWRSLKVGPFKFGAIYTEDFRFALWSELSESAMMEGFAIVCAEFGEGGNLHILTDGIKYFFLYCGPG